MDKAVIQGTFADLKSVKTRSVVQMVVEIPIEQAEQVIKAFGFPQPGAEIAVAVARLDSEATKHAPAPSENPKKPFKNYSLSQQAGMRCNDPKFWKFIWGMFDWACESESAATNFVRTHCVVESRKELDTRGSAGSEWLALNAEYEQWAGLTTEQH